MLPGCSTDGACWLPIIRTGKGSADRPVLYEMGFDPSGFRHGRSKMLHLLKARCWPWRTLLECTCPVWVGSSKAAGDGHRTADLGRVAQIGLMMEIPVIEFLLLTIDGVGYHYCCWSDVAGISSSSQQVGAAEGGYGWLGHEALDGLKVVAIGVDDVDGTPWEGCCLACHC
ncbi:hypothetical protein ACLOJK_019117 [Asimina triloba]